MTQEEYDGQEEVRQALQEATEGESQSTWEAAGALWTESERQDTVEEGPAPGVSMAELEETLLSMHKGTVYESVLPPDRFEYVKLSGGRHFLVLNGFRGPVGYQSYAAWHPQGFAYFPENCYHCSEELKGKLVQVLTPGADNGKWHDVILTLTDESVCEIADKAYKEFSELSRLCADIKAARYPEAVVNDAPEAGGQG